MKHPDLYSETSTFLAKLFAFVPQPVKLLDTIPNSLSEKFNFCGKLLPELSCGGWAGFGPDERLYLAVQVVPLPSSG